MSNSIAPGSSADVNVKVTALTINPNVPAQYKTIILKKNLVNGINTLTQEMMSAANTKYVIKYDYVLGEDITVPASCVLEFDGGSIANVTGNTYSITGNNTGIDTNLVKIFSTNVTINGNFNVSEWYLEWFGAKGDGQTDDTDAFSSLISVLENIGGGKISLLRKTYCTSPLDLRNLSSTSIIGYPMAIAPWGSISTIKIINNSDSVGIRMVSNYNPRGTSEVYEGKGILLQDFYLDCNNQVSKGINCKFNNTIRRVDVRNSNGDGIVLEAGTYPVNLEHVRTLLNKGNGVSVLSPLTTVYQINGLESWGNDGYGLYIEGGYNSNFNAILLQSNKRGGMKVLLRDSSEFDKDVYLGFLNFTGLYTEANGTLDESDVNYDGNYGIKLQGLRADSTNLGKINAVTFINCKVDNPFIEGVASIKSINSSGITYDQTKNGPVPGIPESLFLDGFKIRGTSFSTFSFYDKVRNSNNYLTLKDSLSGTFTYTQVTNRICLGGLIVINSIINFEKDTNNPPTGFMSLSTSDYYMGFHDNQAGELVGNCILSFAASQNPGLAQDTVLKHELIKDYSTIYIRDGNLHTIRWNELPANKGTLHLQLLLIH